MRQRTAIFQLPNQNDQTALDAHRDAVLAHFGSLFSEIDLALRSSLPKVKSTFALHDGPVDLAVHAPWTRYLVRQDLLKKSEDVVDQDDIEFNMVRVSNCGLCVRTGQGGIRILKSPADGMPKALSDARVKFVTNNQLVLAFAEEPIAQVQSLNLFALWKMNLDFEYVGLEIACPRRTHDQGEVDCYWIARWSGSTAKAADLPAIASASDLDEIAALPSSNVTKKANEK